MKISPEDFEEWLASPITEALIRGLAVAEEKVAQHWLSASLEGGVCDAVELAKCRERRSVYREIRAMTAQDLEEMNEQG